MKYPVSVRLAAVQYYLSQKTSLSETARLFGVGRSPLNRWVRAFSHQGTVGLEHRTSPTYTQPFRLRVIRYMTKNMCSPSDASARFSIPNESIIQQWMKRYLEGGAKALHPLKTGGPVPKASPVSDPKLFSEMTQAELQEELEYLRAENAYLKKLKALREETTLRVQQKKQK